MRMTCEANELRGVEDVENAHRFGEQHGGLVLHRRQCCEARSEWEEMAALDREGQVEGRLQELAQRRQRVVRLALGS